MKTIEERNYLINRIMENIDMFGENHPLLTVIILEIVILLLAFNMMYQEMVSYGRNKTQNETMLKATIAMICVFIIVDLFWFL